MQTPKEGANIGRDEAGAEGEGGGNIGVEAALVQKAREVIVDLAVNHTQVKNIIRDMEDKAGTSEVVAVVDTVEVADIETKIVATAMAIKTTIKRSL